MKLPPLPDNLPIHKFMNAYTADQLIEYGKACAEAMRDECTIQLRHWNVAITDRIADDIEALEIE